MLKSGNLHDWSSCCTEKNLDLDVRNVMCNFTVAALTVIF